MAMFLDRMGEDLRQTVTITGIPFKGDSEQVSFPAIIIAPTEGTRAHEESGPQVGAIKYTFDPAEKKVYRSQATYGQALKAEWPQPIEVASQIEGISLRYYFKIDHGLDARTQTEEGIPMGVMIDVQFMVEGQEFHMKRFLIIPIGGAI